mgnify:CR=1 FL=1
MGLSTKNPTKHISNLRMTLKRGTCNHSTGYRREDYNCEKCGILLCPCGTRQTLCKSCEYKKLQESWRDPERYKKRKLKLLNDPEKLKEVRERAKELINRANRIKSEKINKHCECGRFIFWDSNYCRSCAAKKRPNHFYKFLICIRMAYLIYT